MAITFAEKVDALGLPWFCTMELTHHCNLRCVHCYLRDADDRTGLSQRPELTFDEVTCIIARVAEAGCGLMTFTGGECLMRPDFLDIYVAAKRTGLGVSVLTNGTLVTKKHAETFRLFPPDVLRLSVYGTCEEVYERVTGVRGSFHNWLQAINLLRQSGVPFSLSGSIAAARFDSSEPELMRIMAEEWGVSITIDNELLPSVNSCESSCHFAYDCESVVRQEMDSPEISERIRELFLSEMEMPAPPEMFRCKVARTAFAIGPHGELFPCLALRKEWCSLLQTPFLESWNALKAHYRPMQYDERSPCRHCALLSVCRPCPAKAHAENRDFNTPYRYHCTLMKTRAASLFPAEWGGISVEPGVPVTTSRQ